MISNISSVRNGSFDGKSAEQTATKGARFLRRVFVHSSLRTVGTDQLSNLQYAKLQAF